MWLPDCVWSRGWRQVAPERVPYRRVTVHRGATGTKRAAPPSHFRLILRLWRFSYFLPLCTKAEHGIPLLLPVFPGRLSSRCFAEETLHRVPATCTGPVLKLPAVPAGRHLGGQECGEVVLPERSVNPSCFKETLDMPCRILYETSVGGGVIYEIRMGQMGYQNPLSSGRLSLKRDLFVSIM
jgi:hypothetical protein